LRELYSEALHELVARKLILQAYEKSEQKLQPWMVDRRVEAVIEEHFGGDRAQLISRLARENLSYDAWRKRLEEEMIVSAMRHQFVDRAVIVPPAEVRAYYASNRTEFALEGPVRVGMILLLPREGEDADGLRARARALLKRLRDGQDFETLARKESDEDHAGDGGDWGYVNPAESFRPEIAKALEALKPGAIGDPIETDNGIYIVRKTAVQTEPYLPIEDAWQTIEARLKRALAERRYHDWIERLKQDVHVRIYPLP
ncbi:MAG: peptidyl-prolyl cis-trans isomerase, partial [Kiritimatiellae bacterium]|nr:peptidyl-prolyl cis-trans isomerase [Kiritimatiellia bacterium]